MLIEYDTPMVYNSYGEISGFYVCYKKPYECDKTDTVKFWKEIGSRNTDNLDKIMLLFTSCLDIADVFIVSEKSLRVTIGSRKFQVQR